MNRLGAIGLAAITALSLAAMIASLLFGREWLYDLHRYWWVPAIGLGSLCLLIWQTRRWWLLVLAPVFLIPPLFLIYFNAICNGQNHCL